MDVQAAIDQLVKLLPALAPFAVEILKKINEKIPGQINLPWPAGPLVKAAISAVLGAAIAYFGGMDPVTGVTVGMGSSLGYMIARPKMPHPPRPGKVIA